MNSVCGTSCEVGFPIQRSSGKTVVCHLTDAYRRLPRLSSPSTAKASTICAYSLDHITPRSLGAYMSTGLEVRTKLIHRLCERDISKLENRIKQSKPTRLKT